MRLLANRNRLKLDRPEQVSASKCGWQNERRRDPCHSVSIPGKWSGYGVNSMSRDISRSSERNNGSRGRDGDSSTQMTLRAPAAAECEESFHVYRCYTRGQPAYQCRE